MKRRIYNYEKLMLLNPFKYDELINSKNQKIEFYEHPTYGDSSFVICICHKLKKAVDSDFFEITDMMQDHKEYEPWFDKNGILKYGT